MEKPCQRCKTVTITDEDSKLCYDCWVDLDILDHDLKVRIEQQNHDEAKDEHVRE